MTQDILRAPAPLADDRIKYGSDQFQFGDLRIPKGDGPHPVAIVIHGGFWRAAYDLDHIGHLCAALTKAGVATWSLEYRRIGNPGGGYPGTLEDIERGAEHLRTIAIPHHLHLNRVIAMGHSAGGHLALWLGSRKSLALRAVVSLAGVADLRRAWELKLSNTVVADFLGGSPDEVPGRYRAASPVELLPLGIPQKLLHGTKDANVPYEISKNYAAAAVARGDKAELITLENADHFQPIDPRTKEFGSVQEAVLSLLSREDR